MTISLSMPDASALQEFSRQWFAANARVSSVTEAEQVVQALSRQVSQAMIETAMYQFSGRATYEGTTIPCECGAEAGFKEYRPRWVQTLCGEVRVTRAYYYCAQCRTGYLLWDAAQGLNERQWSPGVKAMACQVCGRLHYREATTLIEELTGLKIEESSLEDIVAEVGGRLRKAEDNRVEGHMERGEPIAAVAQPARLYVAMDAAKAHIEGEWHDVKVGVLYEGKPSGQGDHPERDRKAGGVYIARQEPSVEFGKRIYAEAMERGLAYASEVVVLGDGAEWIWNEADLHFGAYGYQGIVDYWHACEHIHGLAKVLYGESSVQGMRWAKEHCAKLEERGPDILIRALRRRKPKTEKQREAIRKELGYFQRNRKRMDYPGYRARGMMIGSGPVEAGCKVVVGARCKGAGMRWSGAGIDAILAVRTAVLNGDYEELAAMSRAA
jgi:hypothetical protein